MLIRGAHDRAAAHSRLTRALSIKWLGQTVASLCWITSMLVYGLESTGDWLQLCAASAWLLANLATLAPTHTNEPRSPVPPPPEAHANRSSPTRQQPPTADHSTTPTTLR